MRSNTHHSKLPAIRHRELWSGTLIPAAGIGFQFIMVMASTLTLGIALHRSYQYMIREFLPITSKTAGFKIVDELAKAIFSILIGTGSFWAAVKARASIRFFDQYLGSKLWEEQTARLQRELAHSQAQKPTPGKNAARKGGIRTLQSFQAPASSLPTNPRPQTEPLPPVKDTLLTQKPREFTPAQYRNLDYRPCLLEYQANLESPDLEPTNLQWLDRSINRGYGPTMLVLFAAVCAREFKNSDGLQRLIQKAYAFKPSL